RHGRRDVPAYLRHGERGAIRRLGRFWRLVEVTSRSRLQPLSWEAGQEFDVAVHHGLHPAPPAEDRLGGSADAHYGKGNRVRHHGPEYGLAHGAQVSRTHHAVGTVSSCPVLL